MFMLFILFVVVAVALSAVFFAVVSDVEVYNTGTLDARGKLVYAMRYRWCKSIMATPPYIIVQQVILVGIVAVAVFTTLESGAALAVFFPLTNYGGGKMKRNRKPDYQRDNNIDYDMSEYHEDKAAIEGVVSLDISGRSEIDALYDKGQEIFMKLGFEWSWLIPFWGDKAQEAFTMMEGVIGREVHLQYMHTIDLDMTDPDDMESECGAHMYMSYQHMLMLHKICEGKYEMFEKIINKCTCSFTMSLSEHLFAIADYVKEGLTNAQLIYYIFDKDPVIRTFEGGYAPQIAKTLKWAWGKPKWMAKLTVRLSGGDYDLDTAWNDVSNMDERIAKFEPSHTNNYIMLKHWIRVFNRIPNDAHVRNLGPGFITAMKDSGNFKFVIRIINIIKGWETDQEYLDNQMEGYPMTAHTMTAIVQACILFGARATQWLQIPTNVNKTPGEIGELLHDIHDRGINLPCKVLSPEWTNYLWKYRNHDRVDELISALHNTKHIEKCGLDTNMKLAYILNQLALATYTDVKLTDLALECGKWNISQGLFEDIQCNIQNAVSELKQEDIPMVNITKGKYTFRRLPKDDMRGLFLGNYTSCCQEPKSVGRECAWHGATSSKGAFVIVEEKNMIVAQSWVWRNGETLCFDNIEVDGQIITTELRELYEAGAKAFLKWGIKRVVVGDGYDDSNFLSNYEEANFIPTPTYNKYNTSYTDAGRQYLMEGTVELSEYDFTHCQENCDITTSVNHICGSEDHADYDPPTEEDMGNDWDD